MDPKYPSSKQMFSTYQGEVVGEKSINYYNCFCGDAYDIDGVSLKMDVVRSGYEERYFASETADLFNEPIVRRNFGGVEIKVPPYDAAARYLTENYGSFTGTWKTADVKMNPCTNVFVVQRIAPWAVKQMAIVLAVVVRARAPVPFVQNVHAVSLSSVVFEL